MDIRHFKDVFSVDEAADLLSRLDLNDPSKSVVNNNDSITAMLEHFIRSQSETTSQLIQFVGNQVTGTISQTNNLTEESTINILVRKLSGSAQILIDDYISQQNKTDLKLKMIVGHLERKFLMVSSPYLADSRLHEIKIGELSYSQFTRTDHPIG